jgi:nicotinate dehydrogenase subunit B
MREGLSRDGQHLYPAFPYTSFTQTNDGDLQALYAHLMAQPAVAQVVPDADMAFPFNQRPLLALWNALYLQPGPVAAAAAKVQAGALFTRGAYLVNGLGHCTACHTPRDALGGELAASAYLGGAVVKGWEAPALGALSQSPVPWTESALRQYLREGSHPEHGVAGGPMAEVARHLATLPDADLDAMAHYLAALQPARPAVDAPALVAQAAAREPQLLGPSQRLFQSACGACHHDGDGPQLLGLNQPLALNTKLHSGRPDNLLRTIIEGMQDPAFPAHGHMPAFGAAFNDRQLTELAAWMRQRFAPGQPAWADLPAAVARARLPAP